MAERAKFEELVATQGPGVYTSAELELVQKGISTINEISTNSKTKFIKSDSPVVKWRVLSKGNSIYGLAETVTRCSKMEALAFQWNVFARNQAKADTLEKECLEDRSLHCNHVYVRKKFPFGMTDHERLCWT